MNKNLLISQYYQDRSKYRPSDCPKVNEALRRRSQERKRKHATLMAPSSRYLLGYPGGGYGSLSEGSVILYMDQRIPVVRTDWYSRVLAWCTHHVPGIAFTKEFISKIGGDPTCLSQLHVYELVRKPRHSFS